MRVADPFRFAGNPTFFGRSEHRWASLSLVFQDSRQPHRSVGVVPLRNHRRMTSSRSQAEEGVKRHHRRLPLGYKTSLCVNFTKNGSCRYGSTCLFAHGEGDLLTAEESDLLHGRRRVDGSTASRRRAKQPTTMPLAHTDVKAPLTRNPRFHEGQPEQRGDRSTETSLAVKTSVEKQRYSHSTASATARREACVNLVRRTSTSNALDSTPRTYSAPRRNPYNAIGMLVLIPEINAEECTWEFEGFYTVQPEHRTYDVAADHTVLHNAVEPVPPTFFLFVAEGGGDH